MVRLSLGRGELPEAFEAEERTVPGLGDLLHLVSGRTLIGVVRERSTDRLYDSASSVHAHLQAAQEQRLRAIANAASSLPGQHSSSIVSRGGGGGDGGSSSSIGCGSSDGKYGSSEKAGWGSLASDASGAGYCEDDRKGRFAEEDGQSGNDSYDAGMDVRWQDSVQGEQRDGPAPQILDLIVQDELVAVAVRQRGSSACSMSSSQQAADMKRKSGQYTEKGKIAEENISMYTAEGQLLCTLDAWQLRGGCLDARVNFRVIRSATPLVRHLHFVAETGVA